MKPCSFMQETEGINLKKNDILGAWQSDSFKKFRISLISPRYHGCTKCDHISSCWGGCPINPDIVFCEDKGKELSELATSREVKM